MLSLLTVLCLAQPSPLPQEVAGPTPPRAVPRHASAGPRPPQPTGAARDERHAVLEVLPLEHVCGRRTPLLPPQWGSMLGQTDPDSHLNLLQIPDDPHYVDPDSALELLSTLHAAAIEDGRLHLDLQHQDLFVLGDGAEVARVRERVAELSAVLLRPLRIEVALWRADAGAPPPAVVGSGDWAALVANRELLWSATAETQTARPVALDGQRWTRYVRDVMVEVASKVAVSHPVVDAFGEGGRVLVTPHALAGGDDFALHVQFGLAQRRGQVRTMPTGVPGQADLELPLLETIYGACSGRVTNGGALAITLRGLASGGGQFLLTIRCGSRTPPATAAMADISVWPCGALVSAALSDRVSPPQPYGSDFDAQARVEELGAGFGFLESDRLVDLLRATLGADGEDSRLHVASGHLFALGDAGLRERVGAVLLALQERMLRTVTVRHRGRLATDEPTAASLHELVLPTLLGRQATVARLLETNVLHALWLEVAQEASILDPEVVPLQSGAWLRVRATPATAGLHVQLLAQCTFAPPPLPRPVVPAGGNLMQTDVASVRTLHDGAGQNGQAIGHGDGPAVQVDGRAVRSTLETLVSW